MKSTAIILSAGQGKRMQNPIAKQYLTLCGKPVLYYSLLAFNLAPDIDNIIVVVNEKDRAFAEEEITKHNFEKVTDIVLGGKERFHSVANGLKAPGAEESDYIFIHDGVRPLVGADLIKRAAKAVREYPAIVLGMPVKDTVKCVDEANIVLETKARETLWAVQTPQVFAARLIKEAYRSLGEKESELLSQGITITDDAMAVETFTGTKVKLIPGSYRNIKITTPEDLKMAEALCR